MKDQTKYKVHIGTIHHGLRGLHTQKCTAKQVISKAERFDKDPSAYTLLKVGSLELKSGSAVQMLDYYGIRP